MPPIQRRTCIFKGTVQGVGFRATARHVAQRHDVAGYVRNCTDGTVELVVEGEAPHINDYLEDLQERMSGCISDVDQRTGEATGRFSGFTIRH